MTVLPVITQPVYALISPFVNYSIFYAYLRFQIAIFTFVLIEIPVNLSVDDSGVLQVESLSKAVIFLEKADLNAYL